MSQAQLSFVYPFSQHNKKSQQNLSVFVLGKGMVAGSWEFAKTAKTHFKTKVSTLNTQVSTVVLVHFSVISLGRWSQWHQDARCSHTLSFRWFGLGFMPYRINPANMSIQSLRLRPNPIATKWRNWYMWIDAKPTWTVNVQPIKPWVAKRRWSRSAVQSPSRSQVTNASMLPPKTAFMTKRWSTR